MKTSIQTFIVATLLLIGNVLLANPVTKANSKTIKQIYIRKETNNNLRLHLLKQSDVKLKAVISDVHGTVIYKETLQNGDSVLKSYDLNDLNKGNYIIQLFESGELIATEGFSID